MDWFKYDGTITYCKDLQVTEAICNMIRVKYTSLDRPNECMGGPLTLLLPPTKSFMFFQAK